MKKIKLSIIGCGNIGLSMLQGFLKEETIIAKNITVTRRNVDELSNFKQFGVKVTTDNIRAIKESNLIIIAVKPYKCSGRDKG